MPLAEALASLYAHLPIPILVQAGETLVFVNEEFADFTGYRSVEALESAGGLDQLIMDGAPGEALSIRRANGDQVKARAHMHRVTIANRSVLVFSFFATPRMTLALIEAFRNDTAALPTPIPAPEPASLDGRIEDLAAALQAAGEAVILIDVDRRIEAMNARGAQIFGLGEVDKGGRNDAVGRPFVSLFAHESQRPLLDMLKGEDPLSLDDGRELVGRRADGLFVPVTVLVDRMDGGGWCAVIGSHSQADRTASEEARLKAEAASLQKTQFLANISHEIRTPMNAILGFADAIASEAFGPIGNPRYLDYVGDIKRSGRHVLELVNDLLDLSKAEAGKLQLDYAAVALNEVAGEVVAMMQPVAGSARVILRSNLPASVPPVVADERSARQIILNLVQNAVNFTPAGGQVIVSSQRRRHERGGDRDRDDPVPKAEAQRRAQPEHRHRPWPAARPHHGRGQSRRIPDRILAARGNARRTALPARAGSGGLIFRSLPPDAPDDEWRALRGLKPEFETDTPWIDAENALFGDIDGQPACGQALGGLHPGVPIVIADGIGRQAPASRIAPGAPRRSPDIGADMMVIAAGAEKDRARIVDHPLETEAGLEKAGGLGGVVDAEMKMTEPRAGRQSREGALRGGRAKIAKVEAFGRHADRAALASRPILARPVDIKLDSVAFRVVQIERFRHEMIGCARQGDPLARRMGQPMGEIGPGGKNQGDVEQAAIGGSRLPSPGVRGERDKPGRLAVLFQHAENDPLRRLLDHAEAKRCPIPGREATEIDDGQFDMGDMDRACPRPFVIRCLHRQPPVRARASCVRLPDCARRKETYRVPWR